MSNPPTLAGVLITYNCNSGEWDWQLCQDHETMTTGQLKTVIDGLLRKRKDLTSFVITAVVRRNP
jgi:hypothetical protein